MTALLKYSIFEFETLLRDETSLPRQILMGQCCQIVCKATMCFTSTLQYALSCCIHSILLANQAIRAAALGLSGLGDHVGNFPEMQRKKHVESPQSLGSPCCRGDEMGTTLGRQVVSARCLQTGGGEIGGVHTKRVMQRYHGKTFIHLLSTDGQWNLGGVGTGVGGCSGKGQWRRRSWVALEG